MTTFYCEHCQNPVSEKAAVCPHCDYFFTKVRCPQCHHEGDLEEFKDGCKNCGYLPNQVKKSFFASLFERKPKIKTKKQKSPKVKNKNSSLYTTGIIILILLIALSIRILEK